MKIKLTYVPRTKEFQQYGGHVLPNACHTEIGWCDYAAWWDLNYVGGDPTKRKLRGVLWANVQHNLFF
jgi:hypothetical protein